MLVALYLPNSVPEFTPNAEQLAELRQRIAPHTLATATSEPEFLNFLPTARAAVVWSFDASFYSRAPELRCVFTPSAGRERVEPDPTGRVNAVFGTFHGHIMAESLVAMISFMNRRFGAARAAQERAEWVRTPYIGTRMLRNQVALLVGYGAIGQHCAEKLHALGLQVHALRRGHQASGADRVFTPERLFEAVSLADHVVSLLPGDASTQGFFEARAFSAMKPSAYFYNLGRGVSVDEGALVDALGAERIAGAFLDVTVEEPLPPSSVLWRTKNLFITPHASAMSAEYLDLYFEELAPLLRAVGSDA